MDALSEIAIEANVESDFGTPENDPNKVAFKQHAANSNTGTTGNPSIATASSSSG